MPSTDAPPWIDSTTLTGAMMRRAEAMMLMSDGTAGGSRGGVRPGDPGLTVSLAGSTINVTAGVAGLNYPAQGVYRASLPSAWSGTLAGAHPTLPRIDLVYLRVWDNGVDASGLAQADVVYLQGTAASSPSAPVPTPPLIYIPLANISVPASGGGSPSVDTTVRPTTTAPGGIGIGSGTPGVYAGQYRDDGTTTGGLWRYNGSTWELIVRRASSGQLSSTAGYEAARSATTDVAFSTILTGDAFDRYREYSDGKHEWGPGSGARDTNLYRNSSGELKTDGALTVGGNLAAGNITTGAWTPYPATWTASTTNPTLNNGSLTGRYALTGKRCDFYIVLAIGSTTNIGSGNYSFALPFTSSSAEIQVIHGQAATTSRGPIQGVISQSASTIQFWGFTSTTSSATGQIGSSGLYGVAWGTGHFIRLAGTYEIA